MTYYAAMLSFFKPSQSLFPTDTTESPIILAEKLLIEGPEHYNVPKKARRHFTQGLIDLYIGDFLVDNMGRLIAFKIGRRKLKKRTVFSNKKFKTLAEDDYPPLTILWVSKSQIILIEKMTKDQISIDSLVRSFESYLNGLMAGYGLAVSIELKTKKSKFWDVIDQYEDIFKVEFTLIAPNFIGDAHKDTKAMLDGIKEEFNASKTVLSVSNDRGQLKIQRNNGQISNFLAWIARGAGSWIVDVKSRGKRITIINSASASMKVNIDLEEYNLDKAKDASDQAVNIIDKTEDDENK